MAEEPNPDLDGLRGQYRADLDRIAHAAGLNPGLSVDRIAAMVVTKRGYLDAEAARSAALRAERDEARAEVEWLRTGFIAHRAARDDSMDKALAEIERLRGVIRRSDAQDKRELQAKVKHLGRDYGCASATIAEQRGVIARLRAAQDPVLLRANEALTTSCDHLKRAYDSYVAEADSLRAEVGRLSALLRGMARRVGEYRRAADAEAYLLDVERAERRAVLSSRDTTPPHGSGPSKAMRESEQAFYRLAIRQRDAAWREVDGLREEAERLRAALSSRDTTPPQNDVVAAIAKHAPGVSVEDTTPSDEDVIKAAVDEKTARVLREEYTLGSRVGGPKGIIAAAPVSPQEDTTSALVDQYRELLGDIELYVNWRHVTRQLTTEQKELWANAVEWSSARANNEPIQPGRADRWWRESAPVSPEVHGG